MLSSSGRLPGGKRWRSRSASTGDAAPTTLASPGARSLIAARADSGACLGNCTCQTALSDSRPTLLTIAAEHLSVTHEQQDQHPFSGRLHEGMVIQEGRSKES